MAQNRITIIPGVGRARVIAVSPNHDRASRDGNGNPKLVIGRWRGVIQRVQQVAQGEQTPICQDLARPAAKPTRPTASSSRQMHGGCGKLR